MHVTIFLWPVSPAFQFLTKLKVKTHISVSQEIECQGVGVALSNVSFSDLPFHSVHISIKLLERIPC